MRYLLNVSYLNRTPNKEERTSKSSPLAFAVLHETAGGGSLNWLLRPAVRASYTHIITRDGTVYHYVDTKKYLAWHAGVRSLWKVRGNTYQNYWVNPASYGIAVEGPNDGTPITPEQRQSLVYLLADLAVDHAWPVTKEFFPTHAQVAPGYKTDPKGYNPAELLKDVHAEVERMTVGQQKTYWVVRVGMANIRSGPGTETDVVGMFVKGDSFGAQRVVKGQTLNGLSDWAWLEDGRGFVHISTIEPKPNPLPLPKPLPVMSYPRISEATWTALLKEHNAPCVDQGKELYHKVQQWGIDPAVALAFFADTQYGNNVYTNQAKNWGNVRVPFNPRRSSGVLATPYGTLCVYATWELALEDWCERIVRRYTETLGLQTLEQIQPVYQPNVSSTESIKRKRTRIEAYIRREQGGGS